MFFLSFFQGIRSYAFVFLCLLIFYTPADIHAEERADKSAPLNLVMKSTLLIKEKFLRNGFTFTLPDERLRLSISPKAMKQPTRVELREFSHDGWILPSTLAWLSPLYEYEIADPESYNPKRRLTLEILASDAVRGKVFTWDFDNGKWVEYRLFQVDPETKMFRARVYASKLRFAVLQDHTEGLASWYQYKDCDCAASPDFPKGTPLRVTNIYNGKSIIVTVNDFGPERDIFPERVIDLDVTAFKQIARKGAGVIDVKVEPVTESSVP